MPARRPATTVRPAGRGGDTARLAALVALGAAVLAAAVLVATLVTSPLAIAAAIAALALAGGCAWFALTRSGVVRPVGVVAVAVAVAASLAVLYLGSAGRGVVAFVAAVALFAIAGRRVGRRTHAARPARAPRRPAASGPARRRAVLIMNPRSGGGKVERLGLAEQAKLRGIETIELRPGDDLQAVAVAAVASATVIGVAGGDGSQALVADVARQHAVPYVCVPAGTRNRLALDLGLDREDVVGALDGFTDGVERQIDVGLVNGRPFANNVSLGVYAEIVRSDAYRNAKLARMERMLPRMLGPGGRRLDLRFLDSEGKRHETAQLLMVSNNPYRLDGLLGIGSRPHLNTGQLGIFAVEISSPTEAAALFALETVRRGSDFRGWLEWSAPDFTVESGSAVSAEIDGEALQLEPPLRFEVVPKALTVLLPPTAPGLSPAALLSGLP
jgi:diacylglycerol kinase family enzyme